MAVDVGGDLLGYPKGYPVDFLRMSSLSEKVAEFWMIHLKLQSVKRHEA